MKLTDYRTLGRSGLRVSPLCLGTMTFGTDWTFGAEVDVSRAMLDRYLSAGGNFIDTANIYTKGHSEAILGDYFAERGGRERVVLATKFCGSLHRGDPNAGGAGRKAIHQQLEQSLRRLRTDYVDLYWMHFHDPHTPMEETLRALDDLVAAGKIRYVGVSDTPAWVVAQGQVEARFRGWSPFVALQIEYSLIERSVEHDLLPMAQAHGLGITPWSPLRGGLLSGKYGRNRQPQGEGRHVPGVSKSLTERNYDIIEAAESVASEVGTGMAQVALAWVLSRPGITSPILGARTLSQLEGNLQALDLDLPKDLIARLNAASAPVPVFPHAFLANTKHVMQSGATINGQASDPWPMAPATDQERW
ncbi:aldo/keto reductase [Geothrix sp. PMB-07]|uniref:aldo/keto reductase n=1 Tax=Geothrix sp. PMB-07 TaxID=3068640 RepID=UPI002741C074|nr:aldo/keto reductase [Geothrix sp. PMB-07]WLT30308.1 aldo/keto reductase [Geothrix sp. PMB-07]